MNAPPPGGQRLVAATAERMRAIILAAEPGAMIGSLPDMVRQLDVGTVTVQQAARILEHEGMLRVRRGPNGGYFGARPDVASLERALSTYLRIHGADDYEALELMTLLDCELMPAAAGVVGGDGHPDLAGLRNRIGSCDTGALRVAFEDDFHAVVFAMVDRPLMELLAQVAMRFYRSSAIPGIFTGDEGSAAWKRWRGDVIDAILAGDPERARFEAERHRRRLLRQLHRVLGSRKDGA